MCESGSAKAGTHTPRRSDKAMELVAFAKHALVVMGPRLRGDDTEFVGAPGIQHLLQTSLRAADELARMSTGGRPAALRHHARDDDRVVAVDLLQQTAAADREVVMHLRRIQMQPVA